MPPLLSPGLQGVVCIIICFYLMYNYIRYVPFQTPWVNGLQVGWWAGGPTGRTGWVGLHRGFRTCSLAPA